MIITPDTYLERIAGHYDPATLADIIHSSTDTVIQTRPIPPELSILHNGFTRFHFEYYELPDQELEALYRAWVGRGVRVPGTPYKLRSHMSLCTLIEPDDGAGPALPPYWRQCLLIRGPAGPQSTFVGKRLVERRWSDAERDECWRKWHRRPQDLAGWVAEHARREETSDGWILQDTAPTG
jgi:hypothetical protein